MEIAAVDKVIEGEATNVTKVGMWRLLTGWLLTIAAADLLLWPNSAGIGWGLFYSILMFAILVARPRFSFDKLRWGLMALFALTALQTGRFVSMSNFLTLASLLIFFAGDTFHIGVNSLWRRWAEVTFGYLRPRGILMRFRECKSGAPRRALLLWLRVLTPVTIVFLVFLALLGSGNSVLADLTVTIRGFMADLLLPDIGEAAFLCFMAVITVPLIVPPLATRIGERLECPWPVIATKGEDVRLLQWMVGLAALNGLFLVTNVIDVIYLWAGRELPSGTSHSDFVHEGVYALIGSTILSAIFMAFLTQHDDSVRNDRFVKLGVYAWLVQNVVLISGVYLRLWIYIDAHGYTLKRVYVALFLLLVLGGFTLIACALRRGYRLKWLIGANCMLLFSFFAVQQFLNIPGFVVDRNLARYNVGDWEYPDVDFMWSVGSEVIPLCIGLMESPLSSEEDRRVAVREMGFIVHKNPQWAEQRSGLSFQWRAAENYNAYLDARLRYTITD